jgi:hypothetical protein
MIRTKRVKNYDIFLGVLLVFFFILTQVSYANETEQPPLPTCELPLLITTAGQSPGAVIVSVLCSRNKIDNDFRGLVKAEDLILKSYKTLIITMGTSLKGMGEAGTDIDLELDRIKKLIEEARKQNILIIGMHIEGEARRTGHCEKSIDLVAPRVDYLIVRSDGNKDGRFDLISKEKNIPMTIIEETLELNDLLKEMFLKTNQDK